MRCHHILEHTAPACTFQEGSPGQPPTLVHQQHIHQQGYSRLVTSAGLASHGIQRKLVQTQNVIQVA